MEEGVGLVQEPLTPSQVKRVRRKIVIDITPSLPPSIHSSILPSLPLSLSPSFSLGGSRYRPGTDGGHETNLERVGGSDPFTGMCM